MDRSQQMSITPYLRITGNFLYVLLCLIPPVYLASRFYVTDTKLIRSGYILSRMTSYLLLMAGIMYIPLVLFDWYTVQAMVDESQILYFSLLFSTISTILGLSFLLIARETNSRIPMQTSKIDI
ncbi:MAG: hypothetical protein INQ03_25895 [Candidatus Heimdallarchaeota archaeon]|nr:hypothetical protein [Candidatus Heimdallarchaeota archaeon]